MLEFREPVEQVGLCPTYDLDQAASAAVLHQSGAIQTKLPDMECSCGASSFQRAIVPLSEMILWSVTDGMQNSVDGIGLPVVSLEFIAGVTAVDPILVLMPAALRSRLEVIDG